MQGLSNKIAKGLDTVIEGLSWDIAMNQAIKDYANLVNFIGYGITIVTKSNQKIKGKIKATEEHSVVVERSKRVDKQDTKYETKVQYLKLKEVLVYPAEEDLLRDDKMLSAMKSKTQAFLHAKEMLNMWVKSPNSPSKETLRRYVEKLVKAGEQAVAFLERALELKIDYESLPPSKHEIATKAKPEIVKAIFDLGTAISDLEIQLSEDEFKFEDSEFRIGYPERIAKGDFLPFPRYYQRWHDEVNDVVRICPFGSEGEILDLQGLKVQLPKVPTDKSKILFYYEPTPNGLGLKKDENGKYIKRKKADQFWKRPKPPKGITKRNIELYHDWIVEEFRRRVEGVWFMNNGVPTYLTGDAYFALAYGKMLDNGGYMDFRMSQLKLFYHIQACKVDKRCFGQVFLKARRTGYTYMMLFVMMNASTMKRNAKFGMTSKSGEDVDEVWSKFSYAFQALPFYFRPVVRGKIDSSIGLYFGKPSSNTKEDKKAEDLGIGEYLNTEIDHRRTNNAAYDSVKLDMYLGDEAFKWKKPNDYIVHLGTVKPTMVPSGKVVGKAFIGSTMGPHKEGGEQGRELIQGSFVQERNPVTGKTHTGLYFYFMPAQDNMEEHTDRYGICHVSKPAKKTFNVNNEEITMGSIDRLLAQEESAQKMGDKAHNTQLRTYPRTVEHAMRNESSECVFNMTKLYQQIGHNETIPTSSLYAVGNFDWRDGIRDSEVVFNHNPRGRFKVSWLATAVDGTEGLANRVRETPGTNRFHPVNTDVGAFGCDPFSVKSTHGKGSRGGLHGKTMMFPSGGAPSNKFFLEYVYRPDDEYTFFEDVIKALRYYSMPILVESNRIDLLRYMRERGYRGFAINRLDRPKEKLNDNERTYGGQPMSGKDMIDSHMNAIGQWVQDYVGVYEDEIRKLREIGEMGEMVFNETLTDWLHFNPDHRTDYDATISSGLAIMACQTERYKKKRPEKPKRKISNFVRTYDNSGTIGSLVNKDN